jgi:hypothetical protein
MVRGLFGLVGLSLIASPVVAETPEAIAAKVQALAHPRFAEREKAARELELLGEPALKALREAAKSKDEELRARATVVADRIELAARSQRLLTPPRLALKFDKTPLDKAVIEFASKSQLHCVLDKSKIKDPNRTVTLDTGEVPYWEAVHAFYQAAGLAEDDSPAKTPGGPSGPGPQRPNFAGEVSTRRPSVPLVRLIDGPSPLSVATNSALRVRPLAAESGQNKYDDVKGEATIHLDVEAAPGLVVTDIVGIEVRKATADDGRSLVTAYPDVAPGSPLDWEGQMLVRQMAAINASDLMLQAGGSGSHAVTFKTGGLRPTKLAELQGTVYARVITPPETLVSVPDLLKAGGKEAIANATTLQVREVTAGPGNRVTATVRMVTRPDMTEDVVNMPVQLKGRVRQFIRINRGVRDLSGRDSDLRVLDAGGNQVRGVSVQATSRSFDGFTMVDDLKVSFSKPADGPLSLVLIGRRQATVEMPFTLKDVPMP